MIHVVVSVVVFVVNVVSIIFWYVKKLNSFKNASHCNLILFQFIFFFYQYKLI
jgi:hypothetical protein